MNVAGTIERVPIHTDANGVVRVAGTRVTLDTIVEAFDAGATAEEVAQQYSSVPLVDVYSVITYYLRHKSAIDAYLAERQVQTEGVGEEVERIFPPQGSENGYSPDADNVSPMLRLTADENFNGDFVRGPRVA